MLRKHRVTGGGIASVHTSAADTTICCSIWGCWNLSSLLLGILQLRQSPTTSDRRTSVPLGATTVLHPTASTRWKDAMGEVLTACEGSSPCADVEMTQEDCLGSTSQLSFPSLYFRTVKRHDLQTEKNPQNNRPTSLIAFIALRLKVQSVTAGDARG